MHARKAATHQVGGEKANLIVRPSAWPSWLTERKSQDLLHEWSLSSDVRLSIARVPPVQDDHVRVELRGPYPRLERDDLGVGWANERRFHYRDVREVQGRSRKE
jgi:hypothetical protein